MKIRKKIICVFSIVITLLTCNCTYAYSTVERESKHVEAIVLTVDPDFIAPVATIVNYNLIVAEKRTTGQNAVTYFHRSLLGYYTLGGACEMPESVDYNPTHYIVDGATVKEFSWQEYDVLRSGEWLGVTALESFDNYTLYKNISPKTYAQFSVYFYYPNATLTSQFINIIDSVECYLNEFGA